ncbi:MAG: AAA family ATPase [Bacteroidota bacterium]
MRIIVFGASGSGTTTLAKALAEKWNWIHLDADEYYWKKTNPPFQIKLPKQERNKNLKYDFIKSEEVIVSGSLITWDEYWNTAFDLGVFLILPQNVRMERLKKREIELYGEKLKFEKEIISKSEEFLKWAEKYDDELFDGRSISQHKKWIELLDCEVIEIGNLTNEERIEIVTEKIKNITNV